MTERAKRLHEAAKKGVFHVTGGGSLFIAEMLSTPGASRTVLDVRVPYAEPALQQLLGKLQASACSDATARALAMSAYLQARRLSSDAAFGLGCTASLATDREKKGAHRAHIAIQTEFATHALALNFSADRAAEEIALADALWQFIGILLGDAPPAETRSTRGEPAWHALISGTQKAWSSGVHDGRLLVPGSFNPLHEGHRQMVRIAEERTGFKAALELSIGNVDKAPLDYQEIADRLSKGQETLDRPFWLTHAPTFAEKAALFPGATFVVGADTVVRIAEGKYYSDPAARQDALGFLGDQNIRFLVFGRLMGDRFCTLESLVLPSALSQLCEGVSESEFRTDVSSSQIRSSF